MPNQTDITPLFTLEAVRSKAHRVFDLARQNALNHFDYIPDCLDTTVDYVISIIQRDFGPSAYNTIPPHGRWQHFETGSIARIDNLLREWDQRGYDVAEKVRSLVDLFFVSVLLDAGAGDAWKFTEPGTERVYTRSEGIAVASLYMFLEGDFAGNHDAEREGRRDLVRAQALRDLDIGTLSQGFQIDDEKNPLVGAGARVEILQKLGASLLENRDVFGPEGRPGGLVDYMTDNGSDNLDYAELWSVLQDLLVPIWPSDRTKVAERPVGDAWPLSVLSKHELTATEPPETATIAPFHKLTQWLAYSLKVPFERILGTTWTNAHLGTGLPEYRNGGLFVDMGALALKPKALERGLQNSGGSLPSFGAASDEIVEWRAMTVALLDELHGRIQERSEFGEVRLSLPQVLEAGSWKAGRQIAAEKRPGTRSSPILIEGDGTLF